jgi:hypothetical protein
LQNTCGAPCCAFSTLSERSHECRAKHFFVATPPTAREAPLCLLESNLLELLELLLLLLLLE